MARTRLLNLCGKVVPAQDHNRPSIFGTRMYLLTMPNRHHSRAVRTCMDVTLAKVKAHDWEG